MATTAAALLSAIFYLLSSAPAKADLTAIVTPGYQFPTDGSVAPSFDLLNLLANPTIQIYGTVGGSNTLAAGSVTGTQLASSVADGTTIGFDGNVPPGLRVLAGGIIGDGLQADSVTNMSVLVDTNYFQLSTNSLANTNTAYARKRITLLPGTLADTNISATARIQISKLDSGSTNTAATNCLLMFFTNSTPVPVSLNNYFQIVSETNAASGTSNVLTLAPLIFASAEQTFAESNARITATNVLGVVPRFVRWVMVCKTNDSGYPAGFELDVATLQNTGNQTSIGGWGASSTNVWLVLRTSGNLNIFNYLTGAIVSPGTNVNWKYKAYYQR